MEQEPQSEQLDPIELARIAIFAIKNGDISYNDLIDEVEAHLPMFTHDEFMDTLHTFHIGRDFMDGVLSKMNQMMLSGEPPNQMYFDLDE